MPREYFCCYHSYLRKLAKLSDQEVGRLFRAVLAYSATGEPQELTGRESVAYDFIADDIDNQIDAYEQKCRTNKENRSGKERPSTTVNDRERPSTTVPKLNKNKNKDKEKDKENTATVVAVQKNAAATDDGMPFGLSAEEVDASLALDQRIEDACREWGLPCSPGNLMQARDMVREYGEEWLFQAIQIAGENRPTWGYVKGVLQKAKQNGSMELPKGQKPGKVVSAQQYTQREYTEAELDAVSVDLIAEARAMREGATA